MCVGGLILATACQNDGVSIEVRRGDTSATRVELYVVDGYCTTDGTGQTPCPRLKTPSATTYLPGEVYTREDAHTFEANVDGDGVATFIVRSNGDATRIPLAVAVGFDAGDKIVGAAMMPFEFYTTDGNRHLVTLEPTLDDQVDGRPDTDGVRVETWYQDAMLGGGCLAYEVKRGTEVKRTFVVPHEDLDCDNYVAPLECDAFWPDYSESSPAPNLDFTCTTDISAGNGNRACLLGTSGCTDGAPAESCQPKESAEGPRYCVPNQLCMPGPVGCVDSLDPRCAFAHLKEAEQRPNLSKVHCILPVEDGGLTFAQVCSGEPIAYTVVAPALIGPLAASCTGASVAMITGNGFDPFVAMEGNLGVSVTPDCVVKLTFSGQFPLGATRYLDDYVLRIDFDNGHSVLAPLVIDLAIDNNSCAPANGSCQLENAGIGVDPSFAGCIRL